MQAELTTFSEQQAVATTHEVRQLEQLEAVIKVTEKPGSHNCRDPLSRPSRPQDEQNRANHHESEMQLIRKEGSDRAVKAARERDEIASRLNQQNEKCLSLQLELDSENARRVQEELERDSLLGKMERLEKERENWRQEAVNRVQHLETKHNDITAKRQETEAYMMQLQQQLDEAQSTPYTFQISSKSQSVGNIYARNYTKQLTHCATNSAGEANPA